MNSQQSTEIRLEASYGQISPGIGQKLVQTLVQNSPLIQIKGDMAERNMLPISSMLLTSHPEYDPSPLPSWDMPTNFEDLPPEYSYSSV